MSWKCVSLWYNSILCGSAHRYMRKNREFGPAHACTSKHPVPGLLVLVDVHSEMIGVERKF